MIAVILLLVPQSLMPAVITVDAGCTLADAIHAANTDAPAGGGSAGSGGDEIQLTADVVLTAIDNVTDGSNGLPSLTSGVELSGNGFAIERRAGSPEFRIFHISTGRVADTGPYDGFRW